MCCYCCRKTTGDLRNGHHLDPFGAIKSPLRFFRKPGEVCVLELGTCFDKKWIDRYDSFKLQDLHGSEPLT